MDFKKLSDLVRATEIPEYSVKNIYNVQYLLLSHDVQALLQRCKLLTPAKASVFYNDAGKGDSRLLCTMPSQARYMHGMAGLLSELEEVDEAVHSGTRANVAVEIGDALWFLNIIAEANSLTLEECARAVDAKLRRRYPEKFSNEAALGRDEAEEQKAYTSALDK